MQRHFRILFEDCKIIEGTDVNTTLKKFKESYPESNIIDIEELD